MPSFIPRKFIGEKMNRIITGFLLIIFSSILFTACIPDRMPSAPVEIERPVFAKIEVGQSNLNVSLNNQIKMFFNEAMDLNSFPSNVIVESISGKIEGAFSYGESDTIVIYTPLTNYNQAEYYTVSLKGGVRDIHGNSMVSPNEEDVPITSWFFTSGNYSNNGFPYFFVRDRSDRNKIYRAGNLNVYIDNLMLPTPTDFQVSAIEVDPNSDNLYVVNLRTTDGQVTVINPKTFSIIKQLPVGLGPTNIEFSNQKGYVTNPSSRSFSVIDLNSLNTESSFVFPDGFRPSNVSFSSLKNKLYFYNTTNTDLKVVSVNDFNDSHIVPSGSATKPTDIEISPNGRFLYILGTNSSMISLFDVETETSTNLDFGYQYLTDGVMGSKYYFVAYFRGVGGDNIGGILKIDINTNTIVGHLEWEYQVDQLKLTAADELLYAVTPIDSTVQVVETSSMHNITSTKIGGNLKYLAITKNNY
jgi:DNA-binding beta-propeller fold protein YncE